MEYTFDMRIGIDCRLWNETGVGRYIRNLVWELQKRDKKNQYVLFIQSKDYENINSQLSSRNFQLKRTDIHWHSLEEQITFPQVLYKENLDLMHFPYFSHPIFYHKPFVVTIHDLIINHFPTGKASTLPYPIYQAKRIGYDIVVKHAIKKSKKIIVPLNAVKDDVIMTCGVASDKVEVTYEGVGQMTNDKWQMLNDPLRKYFLYVGNAYPHKNLEFLIQAFTDFRKEIKDVQLVLVGKDDYFYQRLRRKVAQRKLKGMIFKHNVSDEELFALYANAKALISASLMEGFGLPPLEAMSASCPILLSAIPSFQEVCKDAAFYFDPRNSNSLKKQMLVVYNLDKKIRQEYVTKGLERVKEFSWEKMARQTLKVYESCISLR